MLKTVLKKLLRFYQLAFSPFFGRNCLSYPTCSNYAIDVIDKYNLIKALILIIIRIICCNPICSRLDSVFKKLNDFYNN